MTRNDAERMLARMMIACNVAAISEAKPGEVLYEESKKRYDEIVLLLMSSHDKEMN